MDALERARRALVRLPNSTRPSDALVADVAAAIRGAVRTALAEAAQIPKSRVYDTGLPEATHRRAEAQAIAEAIDDLARRYK